MVGVFGADELWDGIVFSSVVKLVSLYALGHFTLFVLSSCIPIPTPRSFASISFFRTSFVRPAL